MSEETPAIPLADVLRAANDLVAAGLIEDYALGGALAAIYYVEPFTTYDADIIFVAAEIYCACSKSVAGVWTASISLSKIFRFNSLPRPDSRKRRFAKLGDIEYEGVPAKVLRPEHIIAIAASVGRHKDLARIEQLLEQAEIDRTLLDDILRRYKLQLPKS